MKLYFKNRDKARAFRKGEKRKHAFIDMGKAQPTGKRWAVDLTADKSTAKL